MHVHALCGTGHSPPQPSAARDPIRPAFSWPAGPTARRAAFGCHIQLFSAEAALFNRIRPLVGPKMGPKMKAIAAVRLAAAPIECNTKHGVAYTQRKCQRIHRLPTRSIMPAGGTEQRWPLCWQLRGQPCRPAGLQATCSKWQHST
jgi:hypothetical protein